MSKLGLSSLRELFTKADGPEGFEELPEKLEYILHSLENPELLPAFRADIQDLLRDVVELCFTLASQTYDARRAAAFCGNLHAKAARLMLHLMTRPQNQAFGILFPRTGTLHEDIYASEEEAYSKLEGLQRIGLREAGEVVSVAITSSKLAQPKAPIVDDPSVVKLTEKLGGEMK